MQEKLLEHLLQSCPHINTKVASDWIQSVIIESKTNIENTGRKLSAKKLDEEIEKTVKWHIKRINGFGGSDMSVLYTEYKGGFYPYDSTARDIVGQKLCLETPGLSNGNTERGNETEVFARRKFELKLSHLDLEVYEEGYRALDELNKKGGVPSHPWMKSSPDGIYISKLTGEIILVDFKTPNSQSVVDEMVLDAPDYYKAQLAQYKYNLEQAGVKVDRVMLAPFSTSEWDVEINEFLITDELTNDVLSAGDQYWSNVLENELPSRPFGNNYEYVAETPAILKSMVLNFILAKKTSSISKKKDDENKDKLLRIASLCGVDWNQPDKKTGFAGINISCKAKSTTDHKGIAAAIKESQKVFEVQFEKYQNELNNLISSGVPLTKDNMPELPVMEKVNEEDFVTLSDAVTVSVARGKKHPNVDFVNEIEAAAERSFSFAEEDLKEANNMSITLSQVKSLISDPSSPLYKNDEAMNLLSEVGYNVFDDSKNEGNEEDKKEIPSTMDIAF